MACKELGIRQGLLFYARNGAGGVFMLLGNSEELYVIPKPDANVLRKNLINSSVEEPEYPHAAHHIVAGTSPKAATVREILQKYNIDINDASNGVFLPTVKDVAQGLYHPSLHTNM